MKFAGWFGVIVGVLIIGQWALSLVTGSVPELQTEPYRISFHLAAEFITAIGLVIGGTALLRHKAWGMKIYPIAVGMLLYSVVVSPGYFAQQGQWAPVGMFAVICVLALVSISRAFRER